MNKRQIRIYNQEECVVFLKTKESFGGLSNMAGGFPIKVNGITIRSSEALYQACRFPNYPDVQQTILAQFSPMTAKMKSKKFLEYTRLDWSKIRINVMRWCLRVKLVYNWETFGGLLLETGDKSIVEVSWKDTFWGATPTNDGTLVGINALGRLLMELREDMKTKGHQAFSSIKPLAIPGFLLMERPIRSINVKKQSITKPTNSKTPVSSKRSTKIEVVENQLLLAVGEVN